MSQYPRRQTHIYHLEDKRESCSVCKNKEVKPGDLYHFNGGPPMCKSHFLSKLERTRKARDIPRGEGVLTLSKRTIRLLKKRSKGISLGRPEKSPSLEAFACKLCGKFAYMLDGVCEHCGKAQPDDMEKIATIELVAAGATEKFLKFKEAEPDKTVGVFYFSRAVFKGKVPGKITLTVEV